MVEPTHRLLVEVAEDAPAVGGYTQGVAYEGAVEVLGLVQPAISTRDATLFGVEPDRSAVCLVDLDASPLFTIGTRVRAWTLDVDYNTVDPAVYIVKNAPLDYDDESEDDDHTEVVLERQNYGGL